MIKLRLMLASALLLLGLAACNSGTTPTPAPSASPDASAPASPITQPTSSVTSIPEDQYPAPSAGVQGGYPSPSSSP
ncbi:MAG: hypothetical protein JOZ51_06120 [Chloroflexi bacterium]|nr:hypothetical protein [Chloroflexota bacterium]